MESAERIHLHYQHIGNQSPSYALSIIKESDNIRNCWIKSTDHSALAIIIPSLPTIVRSTTSPQSIDVWNQLHIGAK